MRGPQRVMRHGELPGGFRPSYVSAMSYTPPVAEAAPEVEELTAYDIRHLVTYLRLLDADDEGAAWQEVARIVLALDPEADEVRAKRTWVSHLVRARWMAEEGHRLLPDVDQELWDGNRPHPLAS
jgi:hypothetical protein